MKLPAAMLLRPASGWLRARLLPGAVILMYHRVADVEVDPFRLAVSPRHFAEQLDVIKRTAHPLTLTEAVHALKAGRLPRRAVITTFDDGYADNVHGALPLLRRAGLPATVFVVTGDLDQAHEFWWDALERVVLQPGTLPPHLRLTSGQRVFQWDLGAAAHYSVAEWERNLRWEMGGSTQPDGRQALFGALWTWLFELPLHARPRLLAELHAWAGVAQDARPSQRRATAIELQALAADSLVEIGAHTVHHPALALQPVAVQRTEIVTSCRTLEQLLGRPVTNFSYPHGSYTAETVGLVRDAGFSSACTVHGHPLRHGADPLRLPRVMVKDWDGDRFARQLRHWFGS